LSANVPAAAYTSIIGIVWSPLLSRQAHERHVSSEQQADVRHLHQDDARHPVCQAESGD
jgi:hypothetical protein